MKTKEKEKTVDQLAAEEVAGKKLKIFNSELKGFGKYDGIGIEWEDYDIVGHERITKTICVQDILTIDVEVCRFERGDREIRYLVDVKPYNDSLNVFSVSGTAEQAFAIKDMVDDMISEFRARAGAVQ